MLRTVPSVTPPLASVRVRPLHFCTASATERAHVIEQDEVRAGIQRLIHLLQRVRLHFHLEVG